MKQGHAGISRAGSNHAKGYGFLGRDSGNDVFMHYNSILEDGYKSLKEGDPAGFNVTQGEMGPQADQVMLLKKMSQSASAEAINAARMQRAG